jgi:alcohol dehydrogenase
MPEDLTALLDLIRQGKLKPIIDKELPLSEVNEAFRLIEEREVFGKVVLKP